MTSHRNVDYQSLSALLTEMNRIQSLRNAYPYENIPIPKLWNQVRSELDRNPSDAALQNVTSSAKNQFPLHAALCLKHYPPSPDIVMKLVQAHPDALYQLTPLGLTPLHLACINMKDTSIIKYILAECPEAAAQTSSYGHVPLHFVQDIEVCSLLLRAFPGATEIKDDQGNLPLHIALTKTSVPTGVVSRLLGLDNNEGVGGSNKANGLTVTNRFGKCPLQIAYDLAKGYILRDERGYAPSIIWEKFAICLLSFSRSKGYTSATILHACICLVHDECLLMHAIRQHQNCVKVRDGFKRYPLTIAVMKKTTPKKVIETLITLYPEAAGALDLKGRLALHHGALTGRNFKDGIEDIAMAESRALMTKDVSMGMYPFMMAAIGNCSSIDSVFELLRMDPSVLAHYDSLVDIQNIL